jgi:hypothetical protein
MKTLRRKAMLRKIVSFAISLLFICTMPVLADVRVELDTTVGWTDTTTDMSWKSSFVTSGNWSLGSNFAFFLKDQLSISQAEQEWQGTLDRSYLQYEKNSVRLNLGRQGVSWGIGWFFRPTDLITPLTPLAEEETRPGKDLAVLRWSTSPLTAIDFIAGENLLAARSEWRIGATNLRILGVCQPEYIDSIGFDFQGGLAGFYGEGVYSWADADKADQGKFVGLMGWKKTIGPGNQLYVEYFRNDLSKAEFELAQILTQNKNQELIYTNQNYLALGFQVPWDQLTTYTITGAANLDDRGTILTGTGSWQLTDNLDVRATLSGVIGPDKTEFMVMGKETKMSVLLELK